MLIQNAKHLQAVLLADPAKQKEALAAQRLYDELSDTRHSIQHLFDSVRGLSPWPFHEEVMDVAVDIALDDGYQSGLPAAIELIEDAVNKSIYTRDEIVSLLAVCTLHQLLEVRAIRQG